MRMNWYIHPGKPLREDELPPELVVTNRDCSITQVYVPCRTATRVKVPLKGHTSIGHYECGDCRGVVGAQDAYCKHCGCRLVDS